MNKTLLAGVATLSLLSAGTAYATEVPDAFVGHWCLTDLGTDSQSVYDVAEDVEKCKSQILTIRKENNSEVWDDCTYEKVEQTEPGIYIVRELCEAQRESGGGKGIFWSLVAEYKIVDGQLIITPLSEG